MDDEWVGADWAGAREQAFLDAWAVRIGDCPRARCRRAGICVGYRIGRDCVGMVSHPMPAEESEARRKLVLAFIDRRGAEIRAGGPPPDRADEEAADKLRQGLAAARAKAWLGRRGRSGENPLSPE